jgi:uncharacterized protein (UPF0261 family)
MEHLADDIAERANPATAPTAVIVPTKGLSMVGVPGGPISDELADAALVRRLRTRLAAHIHFEVVEGDINSPVFASRVAALFLDLVVESR